MDLKETLVEIHVDSFCCCPNVKVCSKTVYVLDIKFQLMITHGTFW